MLRGLLARLWGRDNAFAAGLFGHGETLVMRYRRGFARESEKAQFIDRDVHRGGNRGGVIKSRQVVTLQAFGLAFRLVQTSGNACTEIADRMRLLFFPRGGAFFSFLFVPLFGFFLFAA